MTRLSVDVSDMGERGLLLTADGPLSIAAQDRIWRLASDHGLWPGVTQTVPGVNNILVLFDPDEVSAAALTEMILETWDDPPDAATATAEHVIPVHYGGDAGFDLEEVADIAGMSPEEYAARHAAGDYVVMTLGAYPGFGYLGGLDEALAVPRRATPRSEVAAGAVMIGGAQTAVMTTTSPTGWNVIGWTDAALLDLSSDRPSKLRPGDRVRFEAEVAR
ncbi:MAG: 5-oxoprolinase subunit PxpB [Pseudomonadota bacterium]